MSTDRGGATTNDNDTNRLETFSDGVIAIAITLLVLEIHIPDVERIGSVGDLWHELRDLWPSYLGYLISFATIGIMWANHHNIFRLIGRTDHYLVLTNLFFLLCVGFLPFPTALLAAHLTHPGERAAVVVYNGWFFLTAVSYYLLWWNASRGGRLLAADANPRTVAEITRRFRLGPPSYLVAFLVSFVSTEVGLLIPLLLALLYVLPNAAPPE